MSMKSGILSINRSPIWLENCILEESKANGHLSERMKYPTKMDDRSTASDIKKKKETKGKKSTWPIPRMGFPFHGGSSDCIFLHQGMSLPGLGNHVGKLAKWHSHPNREMGTEPGECTGSKEVRASTVVRKMMTWWVLAGRDILLVFWLWTRKSAHWQWRMTAC